MQCAIDCEERLYPRWLPARLDDGVVVVCHTFALQELFRAFRRAHDQHMIVHPPARERRRRRATFLPSIAAVEPQ